MQDAVQLEAHGTPTALICTESFLPEARQVAEILGLLHLPIVQIPHPLSTLREEEILQRAQSALPAIEQILTRPWESQHPAPHPLPRGARELDNDPFLEMASEAEAIDFFFEKGWTDGLPIVPPTEGRVAEMLTHTRRLPQAIVGRVAPAGRKATVELIAVNTVMAGCRPEYLPVVLAAVEAVCDVRFNLNGVQATTHVCAPLLIVNGPIRDALCINSGYNVFGQGWRANATIGRALRLVLINIGGGIPGLTDLSTFGHPGKYTYCIAENEEENPWEPFHVERGFAQETSTVTVLAAEAPHSVTNHVSDDPQGILLSCADALATMGSNSMVMTNYVLVALGPEHTRTIAAHGWTKQEVKAYLYEKARKPLRQMTFNGRYGKIWNRNWPVWLDRDNPGERIPVAAGPEHVHVIVAGGPTGRFSMIIPGWTQFSHPVTKPIDTMS